MISEFDPVNAELSRGEKLLWAGQPKQGFIFRKIDRFLIPFILVWLSFPILMLAVGEENVENNSGLPFLAVPIIFMLVGAYMLFGRFIQDIWRRKKVYYALTDKRVFLVRKSGIKSIPIENIETNFLNHGKGFASIEFGSVPSGIDAYFSSSFSSFTGVSAVPSFEYIGDGENVYRQIKELRGY